MTQLPAKPQRVVQQFPVRRLAIALVLGLIALVSAVPHYFNGQWAWSSDPEVPQIQQLRSLRDNGLDLPNWTEVEQTVLPIGNHKWSYQNLTADSSTADPSQFLLFVLPQDWHDKQPQVEWIDLGWWIGWFMGNMVDAIVNSVYAAIWPVTWMSEFGIGLWSAAALGAGYLGYLAVRPTVLRMLEEPDEEPVLEAASVTQQLPPS